MSTPTQPSRRPRSDIARRNWVDHLLPRPARPYARLARIDGPIGAWLLLLPGWWALALAGDPWPDLRLAGLFALGAVVMRGAGCVVNDIFDRRIDRKVARTADRPIASGAIGVPAALAFLFALLAVGLAILLQFNRVAIAVGAASLVLVFTYPLMKRVTFWPQAYLGITFNWGALLAWAAARGAIEPPALLLYAAGIFWTLGYDTIYAHQDKEDDALVGVKSTALLLAGRSRPWIAGFYAVFWIGLCLAALAAGLGWLGVALLLPAATHLAWQVGRIAFDDPDACLAMFKANRDLGLLVFAGLVAARVAAATG